MTLIVPAAATLGQLKVRSRLQSFPARQISCVHSIPIGIQAPSQKVRLDPPGTYITVQSPIFRDLHIVNQCKSHVDNLRDSMVFVIHMVHSCFI